MQFGQTIPRHSSHILKQSMHVLFPHTLHLPRTSSCFTIEPHDSQITNFIKSLFQSLNKASWAEHLVIQQGQTLIATELPAFHAFSPKILQSDGMSAISTNKPEIHSTTKNNRITNTLWIDYLAYG
jgi:hypothetical protein